MKLSRQEWIVKLGSILLVIALFFTGSFFIYWGGWNFVFGSRIGLFFGSFMALFGGCAVSVAVIVVMNIIKIRRSKWVIALGTSSLYVGFFFIYFGLRAYLYPRFPGEIYNGVTFGINPGTIIIIIGILLFLTDFIFKKRK